MKLDKHIFDNLPEEINFACVDYDGLLQFAIRTAKDAPRYTWASERWRGCDFIDKYKQENTDYEPLTCISR